MRALLLTHVYPRGRVPSEFFDTTYSARDSRAIPNGSYVSLGASTHSIFEAGVVQSARMQPGDHYLGFVGFGLGGLVFLVAISDSPPDISALAHEIVEAPRHWFPHRLRRLIPVELPVPRLGILTAEQAQLACQSMRLHFDSDLPRDQLGRALDTSVIPARFHADLACLSHEDST